MPLKGKASSATSMRPNDSRYSRRVGVWSAKSMRSAARPSSASRARGVPRGSPPEADRSSREPGTAASTFAQSRAQVAEIVAVLFSEPKVTNPTRSAGVGATSGASWSGR